MLYDDFRKEKMVALKNKDKLRNKVITNILSDLTYIKKEVGHEPTEEDSIKAVSKQVKQLKETMELSKDRPEALEELKAELANNALGDTAGNIKEVNGVKYIATKVDGVDMNELRNLGDKLKGEIGSGVVVIVSAQGADKVSVIAMATDDVIAKGAHAGNLIKALAPIVGGGGGGHLRLHRRS